MNNSSFFSQTHIYFRKTCRIARREHFWKYLIFSVIISLIVSAVVGGEMFKTFEDTKSGFFAITSAAIWIGIFNSIQMICREHDIIHAEQRSGMKVSAYLTANVLWQFILCLMQTAIIFGISLIFIKYNTDGLMLGASYPEYFITILLLTFCADVLGLMISSIAGNPTTAMTIMPFVLIIQLILSGVLFELKGFSEKVAYITFSKWGMNAFCSIADVNSQMHMIESKNPDIKNMGMDLGLDTVEGYDHVVSNLVEGWLWCIGIMLVCYIVSIIVLKIRNRDS